MKFKTMIITAIASIAAIFALTVVGGSFYVVDQGERGVVLRSGKVIATAEPGFGFKLPIIDRVAMISVQEQAKVYSNVAAYSRDQQPAELVFSVSYQIPPDMVAEVYARYGTEANMVFRVIDRTANEQVRTVFGGFNAVQAVQERSRLNSEIRSAVQNAFADMGVPVVNIVAIQLENIDFSAEYERSIEARMLAEVEVQRVVQNREREEIQAQIRVIQAEAEADSRIAQANAQAHAIRVQGEAEAYAIQLRAEALNNNPSLIQLVLAEKWSGTLPTTMVPNGALPFIDVK